VGKRGLLLPMQPSRHPQGLCPPAGAVLVALPSRTTESWDLHGQARRRRRPPPPPGRPLSQRRLPVASAQHPMTLYHIPFRRSPSHPQPTLGSCPARCGRT
jgi:hypothetical protein